MKKLIIADNLHEDDFTIQNGKLRTVVRRQQFDLTWGHRVTAGNDRDAPFRRKAIIQNGYGTIHLDFKLIDGANKFGIVATLPNNCPMPSSLIEVQTFDGNSLWISENTRSIYAVNLNLNTRYIVDLVGYFNM